MKNAQTSKKYYPTIGIECHVQLKTISKLFSGAGNDARNEAPNTLVSHIDFGLPGSLPVLNKEAVNLAARAAFALNTKPQLYSEFERKHYFYPDLPMGYQISQLHMPIIQEGHVDLQVGTEKCKIRINRVQIEADAGKNTHPNNANFTLVDLNRAGTPLLEIVSEADIHTAEEAKLYVRELYLLMKYADISDCNLYFGNMRFDVNVSLSLDPNQLGTRTETKNINSFRAVEKSVDYEIKRQTEILQKGLRVVQETRGWDDSKQKTLSQRSKEEAQDYRYMPDPDLPPVILTTDFIDKVRSEMPIMPGEWRKRLVSLDLDSKQVELLIEAEVEIEGINYLMLLNEAEDHDMILYMANWFINIELPLHHDNNSLKLKDDKQRLRLYKFIYKMIKNDQINSTKAKELISILLGHTKLPEDLTSFTEKNGFIQVSNKVEILELVKVVISNNPKTVEDIKSGELKAVGFLVGKVMQESKGQADPQLVKEFINKELSL